MKKTISIAQDFSPEPAGRYESDGIFNGEKFRNNFLTPNLKDKNIIELEINLDDLEGVGSSFWDEAFAGLILVNQMKYEEIKQKLKLTCKDNSICDLIWSYIKEASGV
ncbi:MAG: STAS-like domain-containing protein [Alphaproteobacteria bacterium]